MPFGVSGGLEVVNTSWQPDIMAEEVGLTERRYHRATVCEVGTEQQICAIGLEFPDAGGLGAADVTDVSYEIAEVHTDPNMIPINPGVDVETGVRLMKVGTDCFRFTATDRKWTIAGQGVAPIPMDGSAINVLLSTYVTKPFAAAHGTGMEIAIHADALIGPHQKGEPKDGFHSWSIEADCIVENASPTSSNILSPPSAVSDLIPANYLAIMSNSQSMSKGKNNRATSAWTLTMHPTT